MHQGDDCAGVLNLAMLQAVLAERPGIRLPRSVAGAARGAPLPGAPGTTRGFIGSRPSRCIFLRAELAGAADSFRLLPRFLFRGFLVGGCLWHTHPNATLFGVLLCLPTAPGLPLYETETSVRRRFLGSSRTSGCLPVPGYVGCRT
jgi:hypothetical protein